MNSPDALRERVQEPIPESRMPASHPIVIQIDRLQKTYKGSFWRSADVHALRGVSLEVSRGEVFGLLGPNGAGKTTLIKILLGVVKASGGRANLLGEPAGSTAARKKVGYLPESLRIDRHHTARSALRYYGRLSRVDEQTIERRSDELLKLVGLSGRDREPVRRFSKGMYQRLGLAQALLHDPDLLILDEPTDGLDPVGRSEVRRLLLELKQRGKTIFLNSHILQEVELVCDRVAIMSRGQVRGIGTVEELAHRISGREVVVDLASSDRTRSVNEQAATELNEMLRSVQCSGKTPTAIEVQTLPNSQLRMKAISDDQVWLDAAIDLLRASGWSILSIRSSRAALEDVFLTLVEQDDAPIDRVMSPSGSSSMMEGE